VIQEQSAEVPLIVCHGGHSYVEATIRSLRVPLRAMIYSRNDSAFGRCCRAQGLRWGAEKRSHVSIFPGIGQTIERIEHRSPEPGPIERWHELEGLCCKNSVNESGTLQYIP